MKRIFTRYFKVSLLHYLLNPYLWFWAIFFMSFWAAMGAFVFSRETPPAYVQYHFAAIFGQLLILCIGSIAISIVQSIYYASFSIRFVTKFSRLNSGRFYVEHSLSTILALIVFSLILWMLQLSFYFIKFREIYLPKKPLGTILALVLSACFMYVFSVFITYLTICSRKGMMRSFASYIPLMLSFVAYAGFWIDFQKLCPFLPFYLISAITYYFYMDQKPYTGDIINNLIFQSHHGYVNKEGILEPSLAIISMIAWIIILSILSIFLIKKARGISIEELQL